MGHHTLDRRLDLIPIVGMRSLDECLEGSAEILRPHSDEAEELMGPDELTCRRIPFPIPYFRDSLGESEPRLALQQGVQRIAASQQVPNAMAENRAVERLRDEVRRTLLIGFGDRLGIVEPGHD